MTHEPPREHDRREVMSSASASGPQPDSDTVVRAEALADQLATLLQQAPQCIAKISEMLEGFDTLPASVTDAAEGSLRKVETTCNRAESLEAKLSETADRLAS